MTERSTRQLSFASGELTLEGELHVPEATLAPGVIVCHPHPLHGGDMRNNVVVAACEALAGRGFVALRFNFRGVGASEGTFDRGRGEQDDVHAALKHLGSLPEVDAGRIGLIGYSFGAMAAAEVASGALRALALISPPLSSADLRVDWGCPTLVLGGDRDEFAPVDRMEIVASPGGRPASGGEVPIVELRIVSGADHSWWGYEHELGEALADFLTRHLQ